MAKSRRPATPARSELAYSYLRFSSGEQATGDSIRRQTELRDAWIARMAVTLDTSVSLRDEGVSAYTGKHRENPDRNALAGFLELVRRGRIPRGSYLIVESLDRLSREHIRPALTLLLNLIESGIRVVQLLPVETVYDETAEPMTLMMAIMELSRGHSESQMKSERLGRMWAEKKRKAAVDKKPITNLIPAWLRIEHGEFVLIPEAAAAVRRIVQLATQGHGVIQIARKLSAEKTPPIARVAYWRAGYVGKILRSRSVIGEYQPGRMDSTKGNVADGPAIADFFPAVVTLQEWEAARGGIAKRRQRAGRIGNNVGLFTGLLKDARDGGSLIRRCRSPSSSGLVLSPYHANQGKAGALWVSFPLATFETAVLEKLREIDPREILPTDGPLDEVSPLAGRLADLDGRIEKLKAELIGGTISPSMVEVLRTLDADRQATAAQLATAREKAAHPLTTAWSDVGTLVEALGSVNADGQVEARTRLRAAIRRIVSEVWCLFVPRGLARLAAVQIWFEGGRHRDYLIVHFPARGAHTGDTPARWFVKSLVSPDRSGELDLRDRKQAARLEKVLTGLDVKSLEG